LSVIQYSPDDRSELRIFVSICYRLNKEQIDQILIINTLNVLAQDWQAIKQMKF
jgi:hypothetical protein